MGNENADPKLFFKSPDAVALVVDPDDLFGLLTRCYDLAPDQAALVTRTHGDRVVHAPGSRITAGDVAEMMIVRTTPFVLRYDEQSAASLDKFRCSAALAMRFAPVPERSDLVSFHNLIVGSSRTVEARDVRAYFEASVARALATAAEGRGVEVLTDPKNSEMLSVEIGDSLKKAAFSAGVKIEPPLEVLFDSPIYRQVRRARAEARRRRDEFAARDRIEQARETARTGHVQKLTTLLDELRALAQESPDHELPDLVRTFPETDRGQLYEALLEVDENHALTDSIVVGAGAELLFFAPHALDAARRIVAMPGTVGPVRSVQTCMDCNDDRRLLVGASRGVHELRADGEGDVTTYASPPDADVRGGVNSVALAGDHLFASHSELGLLCWKRGADHPPRRLFSDLTQAGTAVRCVRFFAGNLFFSVDCDVYKLPADTLEGAPRALRGSRSLITAVCPAAGGVYAGNAAGEVLYWPEGGIDVPEVLHAGRQRSTESIELLEFGGLPRLFFADTSLAVYARVLGDTFTCRYEAGGQTLRRVEVAPDIIVATNDVRDRLICWHLHRPAEPYGVAPVARLTGHSVQDVCLVPAT